MLYARSRVFVSQHSIETVPYGSHTLIECILWKKRARHHFLCITVRARHRLDF